MSDDDVKRVDLGQLTELSTGSVTEGTFLQRAGVGLFYRVLFTTVVIIAAAVTYLLWKTPSFPGDLTASPDTAAVLRMIAEQRSEVFANFLSFLEKLVIGVFLPLMTAILGYLFGTRQAADE